MRICLGCEHLETSISENEDTPFFKFLNLYCKKQKRYVKGYDERPGDWCCIDYKKYIDKNAEYWKELENYIRNSEKWKSD